MGIRGKNAGWKNTNTININGFKMNVLLLFYLFIYFCIYEKEADFIRLLHLILMAGHSLIQTLKSMLSMTK